MGVYGLLKYATEGRLYREADLQQIANDFRSRNVGEPVLAVDGSQCTWYLYDRLDSLHGGQYKEFRESCDRFVKSFRDLGIRLSFFFDGLPVKEKDETWVKRRADKAKEISNLFAKIEAARSLGRYGRVPHVRVLPAAVVPCATVTFKELGCEVRLSTTDCDTELAQFAASNKCCIGVLSNDSDFLIYPGVQCLFTFPSLRMNWKVTVRRLEPSAIASHLGINEDDLPVLASFVGNDIVQKQFLQEPHQNLRRLYGHKDVIDLVAELVKKSPRGDIRKMCEIAFGGKWRDVLNIVQKSVHSYSYEAEQPAVARNVSNWDTVLQKVEAKHVSCEIPSYVYTVMKCRLIRFGDSFEDLSSTQPDSPPTGLVLRGMLARMYTVLLWENNVEPLCVTEYIPTGLGEMRPELVNVCKRLPEGIDHPGIVQLWSGPEDRRWAIFTWVISVTKDHSALCALSPQHLVVPAAALSYLYHEAGILTWDEVRAFLIVAVSVNSFSARELSTLRVNIPEYRAIYLATLFVSTVLQVLDVAGACGLSFPKPADCHLDAYFDGKLFHYIYSKLLHCPNPRDITKWDSSFEETFNHLMDTVQQQRTGTAV